MKLACVIVFYNPTKDNVDNCLSYIDEVDKIFIIDNSNSNNFNIIPKNKKIEYIANCENLGIAYALNQGAKTALKEGYNYLLTMDQDSHLLVDELKKMKEYIKNYKGKDLGIVTPWHLIKTGVKKPNTDIDYPLEVMTSGNIVNLKAYTDVGGWDDDLFIDDVDIDFCMNLHLNNYKVIRLNYVEMEHNLGNIEIKHIWPLRRIFVCSNHNYIRRYYMARNLYYLEKKYRGKYDKYLKFMKRGLFGQVKNIIVFEKDKIRKIRNIIRGRCDGKKGIMGKYRYND